MPPRAGHVYMFARLLVLFVVVPIVEFYLLLKLATWTDFWTTLALVLATGVVGAALARWQGIATLLTIQREFAEGRLPGKALLDGAMILVAAALLLTPGILTDLFGFSLLMPPCRAVYRRMLKNMPWAMQVDLHHGGNDPAHDPTVVDGEARPTAEPTPEQNLR